MRIFGEFLARESVSSSPIVRIFGKGKCKCIANFSATMVTSLPSLSVCISLSLSPKVPHAQYRKRFRASYNKEGKDWKCEGRNEKSEFLARDSVPAFKTSRGNTNGRFHSGVFDYDEQTL